MANLLYGLAKDAFLSKEIGWLTDDFKCVLTDSNYSVNINTDQYLSDIPEIARVTTSGNLANKTLVLGAVGADDIVFGSFVGPTCTALVVYKDTGTAATSNLIVYIDQASGTLPLEPNDNPVTIDWPSGLVFSL